MATLIPAAVKKEQIAKWAIKNVTYNTLSSSEKAKIDQEEWIREAKIWMASEIEMATFFPHQISNKFLCDLDTKELKSWMKQEGYILEVKWHPEGYNGFYEHIDVVVDFDD